MTENLPYGQPEIEGEFQKEEETIIIWESLKRKEFPVRLEGQDYILLATTAEEAKRWRANNLQSLLMKEQGKRGSEERTTSFTANLADSHILLVSICLKKVMPDGSRQSVMREVISAWPNEVVESLFNKAQDISGLRDDEEEPSKNSKSGAALPPPKKESADTQ